MGKKKVVLPSVEELAASADGGWFDDSADAFLPDSFYVRQTAPLRTKVASQPPGTNGAAHRQPAPKAVEKSGARLSK